MLEASSGIVVNGQKHGIQVSSGQLLVIGVKGEDFFLFSDGVEWKSLSQERLRTLGFECSKSVRIILLDASQDMHLGDGGRLLLGLESRDLVE